jgi:NADPH-dependent glutamate synthase beta subunit-like oxidoreductase
LLGAVQYHRKSSRKKVLVIGGGPAGMSAARFRRAGRGVTLLRSAILVVCFMSIVKTRPEDLSLIINYFSRQLAKLGVKVELGKEADLSVVDRVKPDVVFLAAGGSSTVPKIPGIDKPNVVSGAALHSRLKFALRFFKPETLRKLTKYYLPMGKKVIVIGGAIQGCELAEFLTKRAER